MIAVVCANRSGLHRLTAAAPRAASVGTSRTRRGRFGRRCALLAVAAALGSASVAPAAALGAVGDLTFSGCFGMDMEMACTQLSPTYLLDGGDSVAVSPDGISVYVTANSGSSEGLIDAFSRDTSTGALSFEGCIGDGSQSCTATNPKNALGVPTSVAVSADGRSVYVASSYASVVDVLSRNTSTGALSFDGCIGDDPDTECATTSPANALEAADSVAVSPDGTSVYVGSAEAIGVFSRDTSTGALTYEGCVGEDPGCTPTTPASAVVGLESVAVSPDGSSVYAANAGFGEVDVLSRNASTGALTYEGCIGDESESECKTTIPSNVLTGAHSVAVSPDGANVYVASVGRPGGGGIIAFSRDSSTGALTYQGCFGEATGCTSTTPVDALQQAYSVTVSPDGGSVYAASEEPNAVAVFSRNTSTGALAYRSCIGNHEGCTATKPIDALDGVSSVAVSPDGSNVYVASGATLNAFSRVLASPPPSESTGSGSPSPGESPPGGSPSGPTTPGLSPLGPAAPVLGTETTHTTIDDEHVALTTPSSLSCTASSSKLAVTLDSTKIGGSKATKLSFSRAAFYLDDGIRHARKKTEHTGAGHKQTVTVVTYTPNATASHVPVTLELPVAGLKAGLHTLTVKVSYKETERTRHHERTVTVTRTLTAKFMVCA